MLVPKALAQGITEGRVKMGAKGPGVSGHKQQQEQGEEEEKEH